MQSMFRVSAQVLDGLLRPDAGPYRLGHWAHRPSGHQGNRHRT